MSSFSKSCGLFLILALNAVGQTVTSQPVQTILNAALVESEKAQSRSPFLEINADPENKLLLPVMKHTIADQKQFWTTPLSWTLNDAKTLAPFVALTGVAIGSDSWISQQISAGPNQLKLNRNISNYALYSLMAGGAGTFIFGQLTNNDHLSEAGLLSGEAVANSTAVTFLLKGITQRPRPSASEKGTFFTGGSSFPSEHSAVAWSVASVLAHEYPGPMTKFLAYGLASAVTVSRITGREHFASDALVGSVLGWYMGRQIYRAHHDPELGGAPWGDFHTPGENSGRKLKFKASPYVPLDSWTYAAFDRLAALGYLDSAYLNQKPWTRLECARLVEDVGEKIPQSDLPGNQVSALYRELSLEFAGELSRRADRDVPSITLESAYTRTTQISGQPLSDSFHFGQTLTNDFGRPYAAGTNLMTGLSAMANVGQFAFYGRAEYQQSPSTPTYPTSTLQAISQADGKPITPNFTTPVSRFEALDTQVAVGLGNVQITFGKQSAWLGPGRSGSLLLSDNAEPFTMLRVETVSPYRVPLLSSLLGPLKTEFFVGQLSGHTWINNGTKFYGPLINPQPFVHGDRVSFKPTKNLQFGMGIVAMFGGPGLPFTWHNFLRTYYSHNADTATNPGKRFSAFDVSYRVPGLRKWLTVYLDSLVVDEVSPILSSRPSLNPGLYFPQIPKLRKLELRVEGIKTQQAPHAQFAPGFVYSDRRYRDGYTNGGDLILGSAIGRAGVGAQSWATYHFSPRNTVEVSYRHVNVDHSFLEGGHLSDFTISGNWMIRPALNLSASLQSEQWAFPLLAPTVQRNTVLSLQITFSPSLIGARLKSQDKAKSIQ